MTHCVVLLSIIIIIILSDVTICVL